ncbi:hypothetical protein [Paludisphaera soli]|uniref:hypothetical protein n=1 Tax=Paludisphaera soli TaxID=2712865 RepID=UPI0013EDBBD8|nr:hypothetical protein [Paludisphaera soli]
MSDALQDLAKAAGVDLDSIEKTFGGLLAFLKTKLDPETFATVETEVPDAGRVSDAYADEPGGILSKVTELAGSLLGSGGGSATDLLGRLVKLGVPAGAVTAILPHILKLFSTYLTPDILRKIAEALPAIPGVDVASLLGTPPGAVADSSPETDPSAGG